jgi:hypothetical protein
MKNLLLTVHQNGGDDVTCKPRIHDISILRISSYEKTYFEISVQTSIFYSSRKRHIAIVYIRVTNSNTVMLEIFRNQIICSNFSNKEELRKKKI